MSTLVGVLALRACVSCLLDPRTGAAISSPLLALYEMEQIGSGPSAPVSALVLKDAAALPTDSAATPDDTDPATLLLVQPNTHATLFSSTTAAAGQSDRTLHFRVYHALPREDKAAGGAADDADMDLGFEADSDDEDARQQFELLGSCTVMATQLQRAARAGVAIELALRNALSPLCSQTLKRAGTTLTLHVRPASPSESGEERAFERLLELAHGDRFQGLPQRVAPDETSHQALLALHLSALRLPVDEAPDGDEDARDDAAPAPPQQQDDSVYLGALFERDLFSGDMKLQGVTPWTRRAPLSDGAPATSAPLHFPATISVDYFPGEMQTFQLSLYKFRPHQLARALAAAAATPSSTLPDASQAKSVPAALYALLREEERVGSCEFYLDYFGLESGFLVSQRAAAAQAHAVDEYADLAAPSSFSAGPPALSPSVGRLRASPGRPHLLQLELPLRHDMSSRAQGALEREGAALVVGIDASATSMKQNPAVSVSVGVDVSSASAAGGASAPDDLDLGAGGAGHTDEEIERMNQEQLERALRMLSSDDGSEAQKRANLALPENAVPDAPDVDVSAVEQGGSGVDSGEMMTRLLRMMQQGQTFLSYDSSGPPRAQKLFYVPSSDPSDPTLPGLLYLCELDQDPLALARDPVALANLHCLDLCTMTDIFLGKQAPAFHASADSGAGGGALADGGADPAEDDSVSFSLVTSNSTSLNLEALSAKKRAAWILGLMGCLKQEEEEEEDGRQGEEQMH